MTLFNLTDKVAIVTGGNGGIGLGIARALAQAGASIAIFARNVEKSKAAAQSLKDVGGTEPLTLQTDVSKGDQILSAVQATLARFGRIDILFNNAGTSIRKLPQDLTAEDWHTVLNTNLTSAFLMSKAVYPAMKKAGGGKIINIGSMTSIFGVGVAAPYSTSKGGIVQLGKCLALAWAADNIQVNTILPGFLVTELTDRARAEIPGIYEKVLARIPAGRWGQPADIAGTALWLASSASDYVTGIAVPVDGGFSSAMFC